MVNPLVPIPSTISLTTKRTAKLKHKRPLVQKLPLIDKPTSVVSQKATIVKRRRVRLRDEEEGDESLIQNPMEQHIAEGLSLLTRAAAALDSKKPISADSQKFVASEKGLPTKLGDASQNILPLEKSPIPRIDSPGST